MQSNFGVKDAWPVGVWVRLKDPKYAGAAWFTYIDPEMGLNAATDNFIGPDASPAFVVARWPQNWTTGELITAAEIAELALPARPKWLESYGPQPAPGTLWGTWRNDPKFEGKFHPEYSDDLQVLVHDGGPRRTNHRPEVIWVRVTEQKDDVYHGIALNQPQHLESLKQNSRIKFIVPSGGALPLMVTEKYLAERANWIIYPCKKCGFSEVFDAPSDLHKAIIPEAPEMEIPVSFTSRCVQCGEGFQVLHNKAFPADP